MSGTVRSGDPPRDYKKEAEEENLWESVVQPAFAEFAGTFFYTFLVCMAVTAQNTLLYALACGLGISCLCCAFLNISGGHFNPAISLAAFLSGGMHVVNLLTYLPLQIVGAILGAAFVKGVVYDPTYTEIAGGATIYRGNHLVNGYNEWMNVNNWNTSPYLAILTEVLMAWMVALAYLQANIDDRRVNNKKDPLVYGLAIGSVTLASFYTAGAGFNPAVSFGSAIVSQIWDYHYLYWVGPLGGSLLAALFFRFLTGEEEQRVFC